MESAIPQGVLGEIVRDARSRTGVPGVAAGLLVDGSVELAADGPVDVETPFRVASISKWFTASLVSAYGALDDETRRWLSHTAGLRSEVAEPLPDVCQGLWSYANSGYWAAGERCSAAAGMPFADAMREAMLGLGVGAEYCLGCWRRELDGGRIAFDHEGSVAGFQSLLLIVPAERLALAVLTNSWRGSGLIRRVLNGLDLLPSNKVLLSKTGPVETGRYELGTVSAEVQDGWVTEQETDPLTGSTKKLKYRVSFDAPLMSHRVDFPRPGVARIGWTALPRVA
jgi:CubicO group peptidase (beta-lactamase class C family)